jgi:hypothetical protein
MVLMELDLARVLRELVIWYVEHYKHIKGPNVFGLTQIHSCVNSRHTDIVPRYTNSRESCLDMRYENAPFSFLQKPLNIYDRHY